MRFIFFYAIICLLVWLGSASPLSSKRRYINRPSEEEIFDLNRHRRTAHDSMHVKGRKQSSNHRPSQSMELNLRKGEYMCEGRVCRLKPGEIPKDCNGLCQYPLPPLKY